MSPELDGLRYSLANQTSNHAFRVSTTDKLLEFARSKDVFSLSRAIDCDVAKTFSTLFGQSNFAVGAKEVAFCVLPLLTDHQVLSPGDIDALSPFSGAGQPQTRSEFALAWLRALGVTKEIATEHQRSFFCRFSVFATSREAKLNLLEDLRGLLKISCNPFELSPLHPQEPPTIVELFNGISSVQADSGCAPLEAIEIVLREFAPDHPPQWVEVVKHVELFTQPNRSWLKRFQSSLDKPPLITYEQKRKPFGEMIWTADQKNLKIFPILERVYGKENELLIQQVREGFLKFLENNGLTRFFGFAASALGWKVIGSDFGWIDADTASKILTSDHAEVITEPGTQRQSHERRSFQDNLLGFGTDSQEDGLICVQALRCAGVDVLATVEFVQNLNETVPLWRSESLLCTAARGCNSSLYGYLLSLGSDPTQRGSKLQSSGQWVESESPMELVNAESNLRAVVKVKRDAIEVIQGMNRSWLSKKLAMEAVAELESSAPRQTMQVLHP